MKTKDKHVALTERSLFRYILEIRVEQKHYIVGSKLERNLRLPAVQFHCR